jgi:CO dehydrogenase nickel-insertion accessory protein CooC1
MEGIEIVVRGKRKSGRSAIAQLINHALVGQGLKVLLIDSPDNYVVGTYHKRIQSLRDKLINVVVETKE